MKHLRLFDQSKKASDGAGRAACELRKRCCCEYVRRQPLDNFCTTDRTVSCLQPRTGFVKAVEGCFVQQRLRRFDLFNSFVADTVWDAFRCADGRQSRLSILPVIALSSTVWQE